MGKLLKDPLVHFLLIGAALFAISAWRGETIRAGRERIVVSGEQFAQVRDAAALLQGRPPTDQEVEALLEPSIRDEVLYRESLALGLDVDDDEVRRRLIEKMNYLTQDLADPEPSSPSELRELYDASPDRFAIPMLVTFDQVFFSPSERGGGLAAAAEAGIADLRAGRSLEEVGDHTPLRPTYENAPREQVAVLFGDALADAVFTMSPGDWTGPFRSDFGLHAVRLRGRTERRVPPFDEIREQVASEFAADKRRARNDAEYQRMRGNYEIVIERPADGAPASSGDSAADSGASPSGEPEAASEAPPVR
jgi:hypothetical protein